MSSNFSDVTMSNAGIDEIPVIKKLAFSIWPEAYNEILSPAQLNYMLDLIYSEHSLLSQMKNGHEFIIAKHFKEPVGFASFNIINEKPVFKLQKLYVLQSYQGKRLGRVLLEHVIEKAKNAKATALQLNVNRQNNAKLFYEHLGFSIIRTEDIDIGNGFFMNDYVMELPLRY